MGLLETVSRWMQLPSLLGIVIVGALCFVLGASLTPPTVAGAPAQFAGAAEQVLLTFSKQMAVRCCAWKQTGRSSRPFAPRTVCKRLGEDQVV